MPACQAGVRLQQGGPDPPGRQLHAEVSPQGLGVYLVNPGFVRTRLTALNDFRMPALMDADDAAQAILDGLGRGHF